MIEEMRDLRRICGTRWGVSYIKAILQSRLSHALLIALLLLPRQPSLSVRPRVMQCMMPLTAMLVVSDCGILEDR